MKKVFPKVFRLIWAALAAFLFPGWISDASLGFSNSMFSAAFFAAVFLLLEWEGKQETSRRRVLFTHAAGLIFSVFTAFGYALNTTGSALPHPAVQLAAILVFAHILAAAVSALWRVLEKTDRAEGQETGLLARKGWVIPVILLACWLPAFLAEFPGGFRYDAGRELNQRAATAGFNGDFPLLHSAIVTTLLPIARRLTGHREAGLAVYVTVQILGMAAMYTHILRTLIRRGVHRYAVRYALAYCALFPVVQILVTQEVRDVMFAALFTYAVFCLYLLCTEKDYVLGSRKRPALYAAAVSMALLARNNNTGLLFPLMAVGISAAVWLRNRKRYLRGATIWLVSGIGSFLLTGWILALVCQPAGKAPTAGSSLSLLSQSVTRAYVTKGDSWTEEERAELGRYMELEDIRYVPDYGDATKNRIRPEADISGYITFCLRMGLRYPGTYANAVLSHTQEMWFPASVVDGYKHYFTGEGEPYSEFEKNYYAIVPWNEEPLEHANLLPGLLDFYTKIGLFISFEKAPVLSMLFSIGAQFWLVTFLFLYLWYRKRTKLLIPAGAILFYMLGNAFVPIMLLRYFAAAFLCHPMIAAFLLQSGKAEETVESSW